MNCGLEKKENKSEDFLIHIMTCSFIGLIVSSVDPQVRTQLISQNTFFYLHFNDVMQKMNSLSCNTMYGSATSYHFQSVNEELFKQKLQVEIY